MALSQKELNQLVEDTARHDPFRTWVARDDQMFYRSLYVKHDPQLAALVPMYERKIKRVIEHYDQMRQGFHQVPKDELEEALGMAEAKIRRMAEKLRDTNFEIRGRELGNFKRDPIGTTYYIDLDGGNDGNTGLSIAQAWLTIQQYTSVTVRSAGDIAYVRAATDQVAVADLSCDEDGTLAQPIYIIGCDAVTNDPWGDASNTKPQIDFNGGAYCWYVSTDYSWYLKRLHVRRSSDTAYDGGNLSVRGSIGVTLESCKISENSGAGGVGLMVYEGKAKCIDCDFEANVGVGILLSRGAAYVYRSRFNGGGATGQDYGIANTTYDGSAYLEECSFGQTAAHDVDDFAWTQAGVLVFKACVFNDFNLASGLVRGGVFWEDCSGLPAGWQGAGGAYSFSIKTEKVTDTLPGGLSGYSLKVTPLNATFIGFGSPYGLAHSPPAYYGPMRLWLAAGTHTIKVKVRAQSAYATYPTAAELFLKASYYDEALTYSVAEAVSDEVLSHESNWVDFEVTITTGREGPVYLDVFLDDYEATKGIYVYPFPQVT